MSERIIAIVVDITVDTNKETRTRKLSCTLEVLEPFDEFRKRVIKTLDELAEHEATDEEYIRNLEEAYRDPMCVSGHVMDCDCGSPPFKRSR